MARRIPRLWNPALVLLLVARAVSASAEETVTYAYDDAGRLTNAAYSGGANIAYAYDANGNLVMRTVTAAGGTTYTLIYRAGTGGWIDGVATQVVAEGQSGTPVTAVVENASAVFHGWSDDSEANPRTDAEVMADLTVIASFLSQGGGGPGLVRRARHRPGIRRRLDRRGCARGSRQGNHLLARKRRRYRSGRHERLVPRAVRFQRPAADGAVPAGVHGAGLYLPIHR